MSTLTDTNAAPEARIAGAVTAEEKLAALCVLATELRMTDPPRAFPFSEEAVILARALKDNAAVAASLCLMGSIAGSLARHTEAQAALEEGLALSRLLGDGATEAHCLHYIGRTEFLLADYGAAIENTVASLQISEKLNDWLIQGASFNTLGNTQLCLGDYKQALDWHLRALDARQRAGDLLGTGDTLINIGNVYSCLEDFSQALAFHQQSYDHAHRINDTYGQAISLCNQGGDCIELGRFEDALEISRRAAQMCRELENWDAVSSSLANTGHAHAGLHRWAEAMECHDRALEVARSTQNTHFIAEGLCNTGTMLLKQGEMEPARVRLAEAAALAQRIGARKTAFQAAASLSEICKRLGDYAAALGHYETFRRLEKEVFSEEADKRTKALTIQMEVEHHRREAQTLGSINAALSASNAALSEANARLESLATTDPLTGLPNHRALVTALDAELSRARRDGSACALLFLDIDHFKSVNDTYGHPAGDAVLREFAGCVGGCLRNGDTLGRWGGEEFLALLPGTSLAEALAIAERVRAAVAGSTVSAGLPRHTPSLRMTCSVGASACPPETAGRDVLIEAADRALYAAKRLGRNQVRAAGDPAILAQSGLIFPKRGLICGD